MATNLIRFEVQIPLTGTNQAAIDAFLDNIGTLTTFIYNTAYVFTSHDLSNGQYVALIYGLLTTAQQSVALGYLNALNTALGKNVLCTVSGVTQEP